MVYGNIERAVFLDRPNRFIAHAALDGRTVTAHVKNTGRCRELLIPGAEVWLTSSDNPLRKTAYDLVAVRKDSGLLINIDSQAPNRIAFEWLREQGYDRILPEYGFGDSRIDFYMDRGSEKTLLEVKGCTLERDGVGFFPDAPTVRGVKHLRELIRAKAEGYRSVLAFVIQMDGVTEVRPNLETDPAFGAAMEDARRAGVEVWFLLCHVEPNAVSAIGRMEG
ncbi:MAG: DNA/RNA nuclease SfsA [Lachnospiraceae bacterium]|nr:DNA/RNA nuclease SfsA [Lachnospiraceae bacterium]